MVNAINLVQKEMESVETSENSKETSEEITEPALVKKVKIV
jgi:hypothetical protein